MLAPGWGTRTRGGSPPRVKLGSLPVHMDDVPLGCHGGFLAKAVLGSQPVPTAMVSSGVMLLLEGIIKEPLLARSGLPI